MPDLLSSLVLRGMWSSCTSQQSIFRDAHSSFFRKCAVYCIAFAMCVHRCILSLWDSLLRYYLCLFHMTIFIILKRSYLNFLVKNHMNLWSM